MGWGGWGAVLGGTLDVSTLLPSLCLRTVFRFLSPNCTVKNEQQQKAASPCHNITGTAVIPFGIELIAGFAGRDIKAHTIAVFYCTTSHMIFGIRRGGWEGRCWGTGGGGGGGRNCLQMMMMKCCFTSTETVGLLGTGAQDVRLDFHTDASRPFIWSSRSCHPYRVTSG